MKTTFTTGCLLALMVCSGCATGGKTESAAKAPAPVAQAPQDDDTVHIYVDDLRADLAAGKVEIINDTMKLTDAEDKTFWPIYGQYEQELFALGDKRLDLMGQFVTAQNDHTLSDAKAAELTASYFQFEQDRLALLQKYTAILSSEMSPIRAAQFAQIEHRIGTVIDLMIASQMPLIQHHPAAGKPASAASAADPEVPK